MPERRLFVALPLPPEISAELARLPAAFSRESVRWVPPPNWHLTLLFLGGVPEEAVDGCVAALRNAALPGPFSLQLRPAVTAVDRRGRTEMLWATFDPSLPFAQLCYRVAEALGRMPDKEPRPHVTLARTRKDFRGRLNAVLFPPLQPLSFPVDGFELWESTLSPGGATYQSLARFGLIES
jgi:2'-5' RNA ligase